MACIGSPLESTASSVPDIGLALQYFLLSKPRSNMIAIDYFQDVSTTITHFEIWYSSGLTSYRGQI